jgi:hypothetical protein
VPKYNRITHARSEKFGISEQSSPSWLYFGRHCDKKTLEIAMKGTQINSFAAQQTDSTTIPTQR